MQKFAQQRGFFDKVKETVNPGKLLESTPFLKVDGFKKIMDDLRLTDDTIRAALTGETIGNAMPTDDSSVKNLLKSVKSNINRHEYMASFSDLGKIYDKFEEVQVACDKFNVNLEATHEEFIVGHLNDESKEDYKKKKEELLRLREKHNNRKKASSTNGIVKVAGLSSILDFFANIGSARGKALKVWEKTYPKKVADLKKETSAICNGTERLYYLIISALDKMSKFRANRLADEYMLMAKNISSHISKYQLEFAAYYEKNIKNFLAKLTTPEQQEQIQEQEKSEPSTQPSVDVDLTNRRLPSTGKSIDFPEALSFAPDKEQVQQEIEIEKVPMPSKVEDLSFTTPLKEEPVKPSETIQIEPPVTPVEIATEPKVENQAPTNPTAPSAPTATPAAKAPKKLPNQKQKVVQEIPQDVLDLLTKKEEPAKPAPVEAPVEQVVQQKVKRKPPVKTSHQAFYNSLEKIANEHSSIVKSFIKRYAAKIEDSDFETASKLNKIASLIEE